MGVSTWNFQAIGWFDLNWTIKLIVLMANQLLLVMITNHIPSLAVSHCSEGPSVINDY